MSFGEGNLRERCTELEHMVETRDESIRNLVKLLDKRLDKRHGRIEELEQLVRDAEWLLLRATLTNCEQDSFAADWFERMAELGIEAD